MSSTMTNDNNQYNPEMKVDVEEEYIKAYTSFDDMPIFENDAGINLLKGVVSYGFEKPSYIQQRAIVPVAMGRDVIGQAQSGTGKTGTFSIGTLARIEHDNKNVQAIILSHTHELAIQTFKVIKSFSSCLKTKVELCIGKNIAVSENINNLRKGKHIIIGTPGRVFDLIDRKAFDIKHIKMVVLDEADRLLNDKFKEKVANILDSIYQVRNKRGDPMQICIFSATMPRNIVSISEEFMINPVKILVPKDELSLDGIKQFVIECRDDSMSPFDLKTSIIFDINNAKDIPQTIIYVNSQQLAEKLHYELINNELSAVVIHGKMHPDIRKKVITSFSNHKSRILITTNLLSRGIDIQQVELVINFDLPYTRTRDGKLNKSELSEYIHRIGRSGRFGRKGVAINFVTTDDESERRDDLEKYYSIKMENFPAPDNLDKVFG